MMKIDRSDRKGNDEDKEARSGVGIGMNFTSDADRTALMMIMTMTMMMMMTMMTTMMMMMAMTRMSLKHQKGILLVTFILSSVTSDTFIPCLIIDVHGLVCVLYGEQQKNWCVLIAHSCVIMSPRSRLLFGPRTMLQFIIKQYFVSMIQYATFLHIVKHCPLMRYMCTHSSLLCHRGINCMGRRAMLQYIINWAAT